MQGTKVRRVPQFPVTQRVEEAMVVCAHLDSLARDIDVAGAHVGDDIGGLVGATGGQQGERVDALVVHLSRHDVRRDGMGQGCELRHVCRHVDVDALHGEVLMDADVEVGLEPVVCRRIDHLGHLGIQEATNHLEGQARLVHGRGDDGGLEVASGVDLAGAGCLVAQQLLHGIGGRIDEGVVRGGVELDLELALSQEQVLEVRADPLGSGPGRVSILPQAMALSLPRLEADDHLGALEKATNVSGGFNLACVGTSGVDKGLDPLDVAAQGLGGQGRQHLGQHGKVLGVVEDEAGDGDGGGGAVDETEGLLGAETRGGKAADAQGLGRGHDAGFGAAADLDKDVRVAGDGAGNVRHGHEVARGGDGAAQGHEGRQVMVQQVDEAAEDGEADGAVATQVLVGACDDGAPDPFRGHDMGGLAVRIGSRVLVGAGDDCALGVLQQMDLQIDEAIGARVCAAAEARVDAIDDPVAGEVRGEGLDAEVDLLGEFRIGTDEGLDVVAGNGDDRGNVEAVAVEDNGGRLGPEMAQAPPDLEGGVGVSQRLGARHCFSSFPFCFSTRVSKLSQVSERV
ncbi:hypothetical protein G6O67_008294 [Ophiocordyceps sinensis]|uniref:Uncharacterized protein n=1 Tax=Ophiocordyceps sinensis TaxID=72228 RepID=A0A8H4LTJ8_9HYPO|nr:hypothetical protein G6O67_008294 [Ophiocordyceps sinensis]